MSGRTHATPPTKRRKRRSGSKAESRSRKQKAEGRRRHAAIILNADWADLKENLSDPCNPSHPSNPRSEKDVVLQPCAASRIPHSALRIDSVKCPQCFLEFPSFDKQSQELFLPRQKQQNRFCPSAHFFDLFERIQRRPSAEK